MGLKLRSDGGRIGCRVAAAPDMHGPTDEEMRDGDGRKQKRRGNKGKRMSALVNELLYVMCKKGGAHGHHEPNWGA